jgi:hypothetical protein
MQLEKFLQECLKALLYSGEVIPSVKRLAINFRIDRGYGKLNIAGVEFLLKFRLTITFRAYFNPSLKDGKDPENCKDHLGAWDFCLPKGCNKTDVLVLLQNIIILPSTNSSPFCKVDLIDDVPRKVNYQTVIIW